MNTNLMSDRELLANSFKAHSIFDYFWDDSVLDCFIENLELDVKHQDPMSVYQKIFEMPLPNMNKSSELSGISAKIKITLTSLYDKIFDFNKAITKIDLDSADCAILILVSVMDENKNVVFSTQFNLGSNEDEKIDTTGKNMKRFSILF